MPSTDTQVPRYYPFIQDGYVYTWRLVYDDSSELREFNADGSTNRYAPTRPVKQVRWDAVDPLMKDLFLDVPEGAKAVMFRRNIVPSSGAEKYVTHVFGFELKEADGTTTKHLHHFTPAFETRLLYRGKLVTVRFPGSAEFSQDPNFNSAVGRWRDRLSERLLQEMERPDGDAQGADPQLGDET